MPMKLFEDLKDIPEKKTQEIYKPKKVFKNQARFESDLSEIRIGSKKSVDHKIQPTILLPHLIYKKKLFTFLDIIKQNIEKDSNQIKFKNAMVKSSLPHYNDAYILVKGTIAVQNTATAPPW